MDSIARERAEARVRTVVDGSVATNADSKGMRQHLRDLRGGVGLPDPNAQGPKEFLKRFPRGL